MLQICGSRDHARSVLRLSKAYQSEARKAFEESLAIRRRLVDADPASAGAQRDLTVGLDRLGDVEADAGNPAEARKAYAESLAIRRRLAEADRVTVGVRQGPKAAVLLTTSLTSSCSSRFGAAIMTSRGRSLRSIRW